MVFSMILHSVLVKRYGQVPFRKSIRATDVQYSIVELLYPMVVRL